MPHLDRLALPLTIVHGAENACFLPASTQKTIAALSAANGADWYNRHVIPSYGHIDCIFGKMRRLHRRLRQDSRRARADREGAMTATSVPHGRRRGDRFGLRRLHSRVSPGAGGPFGRRARTRTPLPPRRFSARYRPTSTHCSGDTTDESNPPAFTTCGSSPVSAAWWPPGWGVAHWCTRTSTSGRIAMVFEDDRWPAGTDRASSGALLRSGRGHAGAGTGADGVTLPKRDVFHAAAAQLGRDVFRS